MMDRLNQLEDRAARACAADYFTALEKALRAYPVRIRSEVCSGVEAHVIEALGGDASASYQAIADAFSALGEPEAFAHDWAARVQAAAPPTPAEAFRTVLPARARQIVTALLAALAASFCLLFLLGLIGRLMAPDSVGVFRLADGVWLIGTWTEGSAAITRDVLGPATAPLAAALSIACGWIAVRLVALWRVCSLGPA
jgi:uncharacterized membrane protein